MNATHRYLLAATVNPRAERFEFRRPRNRKRTLRDHRTGAATR